MPMASIENFGGHNITNKYCVYCTDEKGALKSFDLKKKEMIEFIVKTKNLSLAQAEQLAEQTMKKMPAWQAHFL
jgi:hypothetical protein